MNRFVYVVFPLLFILSQRLVGQVDSASSKIFSGIIIDDSLAYAIPSVHIWNESTRMGSISNDSGEFSLTVRSQDTVVFSTIGYLSYVIVVPSSLSQQVVIRLEPKKYEIGEVVVRRFRSYESFIYQVLHHNVPEEAADLKAQIKVTSINVALEADRERVIEEKLETGRLGYITPLGKGIDIQKAFREKTLNLKHREKVIHAKFNRELVADITHLDGDELTEFIAMCNFSEEYLYETDLYTIIEALYAKLHGYQNKRDSIPSLKNNNRHL